MMDTIDTMDTIALRWGREGEERVTDSGGLHGWDCWVAKDNGGRKVVNGKKLQKGKEQRCVLAQWV